MKTNNVLKELRYKKGISQEQCAIETGISLSSIKRYEQTGNIGNTYNLKVLADYFDVELEVLCYKRKD
ncbi:helix-turn-helix domain-containing protein [Anaerosporobacter faecicola]|uniref:helix-turn-helix domain-containing protein n=1 Tax=Anaerosporobacter faecicola TaxID=2718714 RepID=UPI00143C600E|nr:helix-turn-helix transcriptional regulator [Anaerosporobacter faecicola]